MNRDEFIGKLQMVYVGDRNAIDEIVEDNQKLKNEVVYSKVEIDRLNNIINELENFINNEIFTALDKKHVFNEEADTFYKVLDKLKALKENNNE